MTEIHIKIRDCINTLSATEQAVGQFILSNFESSVTLPIDELAERSKVSRSTWIRFSKSMGYSGLKEMKRAMVKELNSLATGNQNPNVSFSDVESFDTVEAVCQNIKLNGIRSIEQTYNLLNYDTLKRVSDMVIGAKMVGLFGMGASGLVAQDLYYKLLRIGIPVIYTQDFHTNLVAVAAMEERDVAICFSHSGKTKELNEIASIAKSHDCTVVAVTKYGKTELSTLADYLLYTSTPEQEMRSGAMGSRTAQLFVVDALFSAIAKKDFPNIETKLLESYSQSQKHKLAGEAP